MNIGFFVEYIGRRVRLIGVVALLLITSCASESCRHLNNKNNEASAMVKGTVFVFKYDGSLQCGMGEAVDLKVMAKELDGIPIVSMQNRSDGKLRTQVCGAPTGRANVYEISSNDREAAFEKGFKEWTFGKLK